MDHRDHRSAWNDTGSQTRLAASPADDRGRIEQALAHAEVHVGRMQPSSVTQQLKEILESFRRRVEDWDASPPSDEEVRALRQHVEQTLQLAKATSPTVRMRRLG